MLVISDNICIIVHAGGTFGAVYGDIFNTENLFGSGGGGATTSYGAGGGIIELDITDTLIVEGTIEANGQAGYSTSVGGGSGGFLVARTRSFEGSGSLTVKGGAAGSASAGAGGGGRMAVYYQYADYWFGSLDARGGSGVYLGGAGTIYLKDTKSGAYNETLIIDNFDQMRATEKVTDPTYAKYDGSQTMIADGNLTNMNTIRLVRGGSLIIDRDLDQ